MWQKDKVLQKYINNTEPNGFTLLELILVIVIISILGLFAIDRMFALRIAAEQAAVKQLVGNIKSALGLEVAKLALAGKMSAVAKLNNTNPLLLLSQTPENYISEKDDGNHIITPGIWYFDKKQKTLVYNVIYTDNFKTTLKGVPRIRYRVKLVYNDRNKNKRFDVHYDSIAGLDLFTLENFSWNVNVKEVYDLLK